MSTNSQCASCTATAALFLCARCQTELRAQLHELAHGPKVNGHTTAGLLDACEDVVLRRTRLSTGGGHRKKGDEQPAPFAPDEERLDKDGQVIPSRQEKAARLLISARNTLSTTIRDLCETRGVECPAIPDAGDMALWLAANIHAIACDESAGRIRAEVDSLVRAIQRVVDRSTPPKLWGRCLHRVDGKDCATAIYGNHNAIEVTCPNPKCKSRYNAELLFTRNINACDYMHFTREELIGNQRTEHADRYWTGFMGELGEFVHYKQFQRWLKDGKLKPARFRRPSGRHGQWRRNEEDVPEYLLADVRRVRLQTEAHAARR